MSPEMYRRQFIEFVNLLYPDGVPDDVNCVSLSDSGRNFKKNFYFDKADLIKKPNVIIDTKKVRKTKEKKFEQSLSDEDVSWLKSMEIKVDSTQSV